MSVGSYFNITAAGTFVIKKAPGTLERIIINKPVISTVITIYDNDGGAAGPKIGTITLPGTLVSEGPFSAEYGALLSNGLVIVMATGASDITVVYT